MKDLRLWWRCPVRVTVEWAWFHYFWNTHDYHGHGTPPEDHWRQYRRLGFTLVRRIPCPPSCPYSLPPGEMRDIIIKIREISASGSIEEWARGKFCGFVTPWFSVVDLTK